MYITKQADSVQSNPIKAIGYNIVKAYNILCTPRRRATQTESKIYSHPIYGIVNFTKMNRLNSLFTPI